MYDELLYLERKFVNVRLARKRFAPIWGGSSLLASILSCFEDIFTVWKDDWDFVVNLSETDFPLKYAALKL